MIGNLYLYENTTAGILKLKTNISKNDILDEIIQFYIDLKCIKSYRIIELVDEELLIFRIITTKAEYEYYFSTESNSFELLCKLQKYGIMSR